MTATVHDLLAELGHAHDFADAPCVGRWEWFDPPGEHEPAASVQSRHEAAVHVCGTCPLPVFARCAALSRTLPKAGRHGVWAGRSYDLPRHERQPAMTATRHTRAPRTPCAHPRCPYLSRDTYCPLHATTTKGTP